MWTRIPKETPPADSSKDVEFEETLYDVLLDDVSIEEAVVKTDIKKLSILPASIDLAGAEIEMVSMEKREFLMKRKTGSGTR